MDHNFLCTSNTSADLLGTHLGPEDHLDLTPSPCCRLAHMARHHREGEATPTGGMDPAMVHLIIICRPNETTGTGGNRADYLSRAQVIHSLPTYLLDFLNVPISLDIPMDVDRVLTVLH